MVAFATSSAARSAAALACATCALASLTFAWLTISCRLRDEALSEETLRAFVRAAGEFGVGSLGLDDVFLQLRFGPLERGARRLEVRFGAAQRRGQLFAIELHEDVAGADGPVDVGIQDLDDAVRLRFDLDLRDRLDLAGGDHRFHHRAAFNRRKLRGVHVRRRAVQRHKTDGGGDNERAHSACQVQTFP